METRGILHVHIQDCISCTTYMKSGLNLRWHPTLHCPLPPNKINGLYGSEDFAGKSYETLHLFLSGSVEGSLKQTYKLPILIFTDLRLVI